MRMRQRILLLGFWVLWSTTLFGAEIEGVFSPYHGEIILIRGNKTVDTLEVRSNGTFNYHCQVSQPYTQLSITGFGKESIVVMLNPKDKIIVEAKKDANGKLEVAFHGDRKELNHYLTVYMQRNGFGCWSMEKLAKVSFKEHAAAVEEMEKELSGLLRQVRGKEDEDLVEMLELDLYSSMLNLKQRYCWAVRAINHEPMDKDADYVAFNRSLDMNNVSWLEKEKGQDITGYPGLVDGRIRWEMAINEGIIDTSALYTLEYMKWVRKIIKNDTVANFFINRRISRYMNRGGDEHLKKTYEGFMCYSTDESMKKEITQVFQMNLALAKGKPAPDFEMKDKDGNTWKLSDFKGKVLYIDVWATWCGPCCAEIPFMEKRYEQYKNNSHVEFISISVDNDQSAWRKKIDQDKPLWKQFIVEDGFKSGLCEKYGIRSIPRFLLIDEKGNIISVKASRPSNPMFETYFVEQIKN